jgi:NAD(P)-dependent dehydrogenase (short-subunit alcohol dehydrogenase family)
MIALVDRAERYLKERRAWILPGGKPVRRTERLAIDIARLRRDLSAVAGVAMIVMTSQSPDALRFCRSSDAATLAAQGPATPDHSIRTKRIPMIARDVHKYASDYQRYFKTHAAKAQAPKTMLDPAPRVVLDPQLGLCAAGRSFRDAQIARELYEHNIEIIRRAAALGNYRALSARDVFDVEYWDLEQAKLTLAGKMPEFGGEIALVTGGASGIGRACVDALLGRGAAVIALDINAAVANLTSHPAYFGLHCDVTDTSSVAKALEAAVRRFGGLDMLVLNAAIYPHETSLATLESDLWRSVMAVNVEANLALLKGCHPLLALAPNGGRVVIIGSKNVPAPGPGFGAYSASKAALTQVARLAALEWGKDQVRVNVVHPDAVFDTALWTEDVLRARAARYGLSVEQYKARNVLKTSVRSADVAQLVCAMCGAAFSRTTGAQVPIDGGNERVI